MGVDPGGDTMNGSIRDPLGQAARFFILLLCIVVHCGDTAAREYIVHLIKKYLLPGTLEVLARVG